MSKPAFTEEEINQLNDLFEVWGYECGVSDSIRLLESIKCEYKDIPSFIFLLKKELNKKKNEYKLKYQEKYPSSTLDNKLVERMEYTEKHKISNHE